MLKGKLFFIIVCLGFVLLFVTGYHFESTQTVEYNAFHQDMQEKNEYIYKLLPVLKDDKYIEDMYLFYSDRDLIDSYYTVYLNCRYSEKEYRTEKTRISELFESDGYLIKNSSLFNYESLMGTHRFFHDSSDVDLMNYEYVLFSESDYRIVYVTFFDKELNGKSINIPKMYLPKELISLRNENN